MKKTNLAFLMLTLVVVAMSLFLYLTNDKQGKVLGEGIATQATVRNITTGTLTYGVPATLEAEITNDTDKDFIVQAVLFKIPRIGDDKILCAASLVGKTKVTAGSTQKYSCSWTPDETGTITMRLRVNWEDIYSVNKDFVVAGSSGNVPDTTNKVTVTNITTDTLKTSTAATLKAKIINNTTSDFPVSRVEFKIQQNDPTPDIVLCTASLSGKTTVAKNGGIQYYDCSWTPTTNTPIANNKVSITLRVNSSSLYVVNDFDFNGTVATNNTSAGTVAVENITTDSLKVGQKARLEVKIINNTASNFLVNIVQFFSSKGLLCSYSVTDPADKIVASNGGIKNFYCDTWTPTAAGQITMQAKINYVYTDSDVFTVASQSQTQALGSISQPVNLPVLERHTIQASVALLKDTDGDKLDDIEEGWWGTDPNKVDTDGDSYSDYTEISNCYSPLEKNGLKRRCVTKYYGKLIMDNLSGAYANKFMSLKVELRNKVKALIGSTKLNRVSSANWEKYVRAYVYGRYTPEEIAYSIIEPCLLVHPNFPAVDWRQGENYNNCLR